MRLIAQKANWVGGHYGPHQLPLRTIGILANISLVGEIQRLDTQEGGELSFKNLLQTLRTN